MTGYVIRRVLQLIPVLWAVATITFFLMHMVPGGPFTQDKKVPADILAALNRRYNLDQPLWKQYLLYLWNLLHGDLGLSFRGDRDVSQLIRDGFFVTAQLGILAFIVASVVGLTLGILSALNQNGILDYVGVFFATIGAALPNFVMASFLIIIFAIKFHWFQVLGWGGPIQVSQVFDASAWDWKKMVLPVIALSTLPAAYIARVTRASMLEVLAPGLHPDGARKGTVATGRHSPARDQERHDPRSDGDGAHRRDSGHRVVHNRERLFHSRRGTSLRRRRATPRLRDDHGVYPLLCA